MSIYTELAEHITEGRAADIDIDELSRWLDYADRSGHPAWSTFDNAVDELVAAYQAQKPTTAPPNRPPGMATVPEARLFKNS